MYLILLLHCVYIKSCSLNQQRIRSVLTFQDSITPIRQRDYYLGPKVLWNYSVRIFMRKHFLNDWADLGVRVGRYMSFSVINCRVRQTVYQRCVQFASYLIN